MNYLEQARDKLRKELPAIKGNKEGAIKNAAMEALLNFAGQDEEFAQAIVQGGSFADCMREVCKGIGTSISDLEVYSRAAAFYFPGSKVRFEMHIDLVGESDTPLPGAEEGGALSPQPRRLQDEANKTVLQTADAARREGGKKGGLVLNLADFL